MSELTFHPLTPADYPLAVEFKRQTFTDNGSPPPSTITTATSTESLETFFNNLFGNYQKADPASVALMMEGTTPIGLVAVNVSKPLGYVNNFYIVPNRRGLGYGRIMENYALTVMRRHGKTKAILHTGKNAIALGFYKKLGWQITGADPHNPETMFRLEKEVV